MTNQAMQASSSSSSGTLSPQATTTSLAIQRYLARSSQETASEGSDVRLVPLGNPTSGGDGEGTAEPQPRSSGGAEGETDDPQTPLEALEALREQPYFKDGAQFEGVGAVLHKTHQMSDSPSFPAIFRMNTKYKKNVCLKPLVRIYCTSIQNLIIRPKNEVHIITITTSRR